MRDASGFPSREPFVFKLVGFGYCVWYRGFREPGEGEERERGLLGIICKASGHISPSFNSAPPVAEAERPG